MSERDCAEGVGEVVAQSNSAESAEETVVTEKIGGEVESVDSLTGDVPQISAGEGDKIKLINIYNLAVWPLLREDAKKVARDLDEPFSPQQLELLGGYCGC